MNTAIIVAAGKSERMGGKVDKAFLSLGPKPVLAYSLMAFEACADIDAIIVVVRKDQVIATQGVARMFGCRKVQAVVPGGSCRQASVRNGMKECDPDTTIVSVHDAARPCITPALISETIKSAKRNGSGIAAQHMTDTVKLVEKGQTVSSTLDRSKIWTVQTPQTFKFDLLARAFDAADINDETITDEASAVEKLGEKVHLIPSRFPNIKITVPEDLHIAALLLGMQA
ncbi:MAG: 2-C-methyl-D-erythritol 4-phosphate cytidylyltransferase [Kiritimatiellae bacterium]|jgi:2-C-methyl-D-erythritol 4-phosphate cytidylyltransferase|nr:2-C-methyl-D-erythritol 4-phosphate cytidylyltransferase [Kiritimatiellia bacterium]